MRTDLEKQGLRGPVKSVLIETAQFEEHDGKISEKPWFSHTITFNKDGQVIEQLTRNRTGRSRAPLASIPIPATCWRREALILPARLIMR